MTPSSSPRILLFYGEAGAGHRRAAEAIAGQLHARGATIAWHDALHYTHPLFRAVYVRGGLGLITRLPQLYHLIYQISDYPAINRVLRVPRYHSEQACTRALFRVIAAFQPDVIVCTHFLAAELCAGWRRSGQLSIPLYTVITDFDPHYMWQHAGTDHYCAPTPEARARLIHDGVDPAMVEVTGIPIDSGFTVLPDRTTAARRLHLDPRRPVLLIMGGGLGVGAMKAVACALLAQPPAAQIVFITGSNHALRRQLKAMSDAWIVRGFVSNMPDWLAVADVAITKAGALATSELLAAGIPAIIPRALTGHEALNAQYLAATGAAVLVDSAVEGLAQVERLLHERPQRMTMSLAARQAARPEAAALIAELVLNTPRLLSPYPAFAIDHVEHPTLSTC